MNIADTIEGFATSRAPRVLIAGCGAAGASAALSAVESGAKVLVCDRAPESERGGSSRANHLYMAMKDTDEPMDYMVPGLLKASDPRPSMFGETNTTSAFWGYPDDFLDAWINDASPTLKWFEAMGVPFTFRESDLIDDGVFAGLTPAGGGKGLIDLLEQKARAKGASFVYDTALVGLQSDRTGKITAATLETAQGRVAVECDAVILATGGFQGNHEMLTCYVGKRQAHVVPMTRYSYYNKGDGLRLGLELGAATTGDFSQTHTMAIDARSDGQRWLLLGGDLGIMVNRHGDRFADESTGEPADRLICEQEDGIAFLLLDAEMMRRPFIDRRIGAGRGDGEGKPIVASSIEELADALQIPAANLRRTITEYNAACQSADGTAGTKGLAIDKTGGAIPLTEMPLHAWPARSGLCFCLGGLKIDGNGRVLSQDGHAIPGLYAAGDTAGGYFHDYVAYTSSLKALIFGRRSGAHAAGTMFDGYLPDRRPL